MSIQHYVAANANPVRPDEATHYRHLVTYADHLAALRDCEERMLNAAREAVAALATERELRSPSGVEIDIHQALAAIDALTKGEQP